jgi:putative hydrolase of the HAD superfamily
MTSRVEAVVFDLLYTLVHPGTYPGGSGRIGWLAHILGVESAALQARWAVFEPALESGQVSQSSDGLGPELDWVRTVAVDPGVDVSPDDLARIDAGWDLTRRAALLNPPVDTMSTLMALRERKLRVGLLSNTHGLELRSWHQSPLAPRFDVTAFSHEIGATKPDSAAYAYVLDRLDVPAASAAYVGDGSSNELAGAKAAGFGLVILAEQAPAQLAPDDLDRLRAQADTAVSSLLQVVDLISG